MFEESVSSLPSIWASVNSWFTPTVLFVLLNLMIGTIAITSGLNTQKHHGQQQQQHEPQERPQAQELARSPSVLQRLKSINFYNYRSQEPDTAFQKAAESDNNYAFRHTHEDDEQTQQYLRSPSFLQKLKSISLQNYISQEFSSRSQSSTSTTTLRETQQPETHFHFEQTFEQEQPKEEQREEEHEQIEEEEDQVQSLDEIYGQLKGDQVSRTKSDTKPRSGEVPTKLAKKMKKSASAKSAFAHFEENEAVESRRPATVREGKPKATEADEEVDAKADDFINKFKQQLKLQRLDSIMRYKETINRGSGK
ncbi:hypothetical protein FNV43_RR12718 [Rhamnella rubrinervis]|uniref:DUF4408 domain-containing protein n=1 Tax=Rhamnella rubrinervis TaxID=2594499 RepID=A0A8K0MIW7_9ROSA|nr:hypothetical protein FNV43_RR12718 [Rhamnella rubrinervis]